MSERLSGQAGALQMLDPRVRLVGILLLVVSTVLCSRIEVLIGVFVLAVMLALASRVKVSTLAKRVWWIALGFTGLMVAPALITTPGDPMLALPWNLSVTDHGLQAALLLILRVETAVTLTATLVLCTPWNQILKALRTLGVPPELVAILVMTHRYIFLLMESANQMFDSRQSRAVGPFRAAQQRAIAARSAGVLLSKSMDLSYDVYQAMTARGFRGEVRTLETFRMRSRDYASLIAFVGIAITIAWIGR